MERGASGSSHHHQHAAAASTAAAGHSYMTHHGAAIPADLDYEYNTPGKSSFDNPATKKKPPKLKAISRSLSMAIDNYAPPMGGGGGGGGGTGSPPTMMLDDTMIVEQPLIHRSASPLPLRSAPPQTLAIPTHQMHGDGSRVVSPALSARQQHHQQQQQHSLHTFQNMVAHARHQQQQQQQQHQHHSSSTSSPTSHAVSPLPVRVPLAHQPDIYLVSSSSLGEDVGALGGGIRGGSSSPIQFIDDYMLPPSSSSHRHTVSATHPLKKNMFRRSDTIDVHPASTFQMKKTHSFHAQQDSAATMDQMLLSAAAAASQGSSASSSRRTSSVRGNFLMPGHPSGASAGKELSRSPSPSRRGCRSHRSFNDPGRRPSIKPESVVESQIRHPSLNDELMESLEGRAAASLFPQQNLSLENELFVESRSRSNSSTKMEDIGMEVAAAQRAAAVLLARKSSGSFEDGSGAAVMTHGGTHPPSASASSLKKRGEHPHTRQHSSQSLELDARPSTSAAAAAAAAVHGHSPHALQLHSAAAAATAAYHFKRGAQHGRSLYLSPNNLEELQVHQRPSVLAAAAAFQGTNASASVKQAKALHSASMRLRTYRETLSATKKSKSFIGDSAYPPTAVTGNEFELTSPHRRNSRPLSSAVGGTVEDIKRSPRPLALTPTSATAATAFMEEKRPSFERKPSLTYELSDAAFEQVLRPFHHKVAGRKASMSGAQAHKALKKKSLSDETDEDEEAHRKRKRIVCIVMTVFFCLACASVLVVVLTLTHSSSHTTHHPGPTKKIHSMSRETPVHYNVRQESERLLKESLDRARSNKNATEAAAHLALQQIP
ncbi:PREDICTED: uncharacterized protein LOC108969881 [Bactrocera latifrons]|uniref:uncharacterized protein LOC108969881 n=1 Tax=Bactrocera latifrons TaxID=174628 RepID=UPI0008DDCB71|nr:PREDICTED: uncharacterized protein LOC108969881 [Bactrocera latifrons]